eukprot:CAMPEP_0202867382 /NCGR_PEP_ID=MMETSP1391-20130828/9315_1 /ASSEMBLY_ACC=CAM_ASM_000867 /TAXON_ID=1034604 /ORGANISM="Chlamydomonas leiostraca, Strain SAG 11-49" /LENGTH=283 /DNA_ID=CAMNT_0049547425 /DNA_START=91 /DNA_END=942 /DNA_ORIENTATION=+
MASASRTISIGVSALYKPVITRGTSTSCSPMGGPAWSEPSHHMRLPRVSAAASGAAPCARSSRRVVRCRAQSDKDPFDDLFRSKVFSSEMVMKEFNSMVNELMGLSRMASKFPDFDIAGKRMFLEKMREGGERYELFIKRLELSDDPAAREYLRSTNAQMLNGGFTLKAMFDGLKGSLQQYEQWVEQEERAVAAGPEVHAQFLKAFKGVWQQTALGAIDTSQLAQSLPPEVLLRAQRDPQFWAAIREISDNPSPEVLNKWMSNENLSPLITELARTMLNKRQF